MSRQRGAALLLVMWLVLLLAGLVAGYAMASRIESLQGAGVSRGLVASEAARAGIEFAASRMLDADPARRWAANGRAYRFEFDGIPVEVSVRDESGKIDLNQSAPDLLAKLFEGLGEEPSAAVRLAGAIVDWRDDDTLVQPAGGAEDGNYRAAGLAWGATDAPFETVAEVEQVLGMRPALFAAASPHLTVHGGRGLPDPRFADDIVLAAMGVERPGQIDPDAAPEPGSGTYSIYGRASLPEGRRADLSVVLRMGGSGLPGSTYTPLRWQTGSVAR